jgi:hypothetical protein
MLRAVVEAALDGTVSWRLDVAELAQEVILLILHIVFGDWFSKSGVAARSWHVMNE